MDTEKTKKKNGNLPIFSVRRSALKTPIVRQLENKYGGKWTYYPFSGWGCDKPKMLAHYVYEGGYDINGNPMEENKLLSAFKALRVYGNGKNGERFYPERGQAALRLIFI